MKRELALASCPAVTVSESALQVPRLNRRMVRARPDVWGPGRVWHSAELYSRGAVVNGGRLFGHLFLVSRRRRGIEKDLNPQGAGSLLERAKQ